MCFLPTLSSPLVRDSFVSAIYYECMSTIGERLKLARTSRRMKQRQVADLFGIERASVAQWEAGTSRPALDKIAALAKAFDCSEAWLLNGSGAPPSGAEPVFPHAEEIAAGLSIRLRWIRESLGKSEAEMADYMSASLDDYGAWERGLAIPDAPHAMILWDQNKVSLDFLYIGRTETLPNHWKKAWSERARVSRSN